MGDTWDACAGRGDGSGCPHGETGTVTAGRPVYRCVDCRDCWGLDETEPWRRPGDDDT
ncbi:hypothetical protein ACTWJ9_33110 (plasmid) [Streptomyces sp. GDS52]|uniref:hypothetical protein n=1 Tax=Streptomyces sp. GDS52 TaxID=3406419 RepID=UPI003FD54EDD